MITAESTIFARTYGEAIEQFGAQMDALKDGKWKLVSAHATPVLNNAGEPLHWKWEMEGEWL